MTSTVDYSLNVASPYRDLDTASFSRNFDTDVELAAWVEVQPCEADLDPHVAAASSVVERLVEQYAMLAVKHARCKRRDDGTYYADVVFLRGAWAEGDSPEAARDELRSVIESWALLKIEHHDGDIPPLEGLDLNNL